MGHRLAAANPVQRFRLAVRNIRAQPPRQQFALAVSRTVTFAAAGGSHSGATLVSVAAASTVPGQFGQGPFLEAGVALGHV